MWVQLMLLFVFAALGFAYEKHVLFDLRGRYTPGYVNHKIPDTGYTGIVSHQIFEQLELQVDSSLLDLIWDHCKFVYAQLHASKLYENKLRFDLCDDEYVSSVQIDEFKAHLEKVLVPLRDMRGTLSGYVNNIRVPSGDIFIRYYLNNPWFEFNKYNYTLINVDLKYAAKNFRKYTKQEMRGLEGQNHTVECRDFTTEPPSAQPTPAPIDDSATSPDNQDSKQDKDNQDFKQDKDNQDSKQNKDNTMNPPIDGQNEKPASSENGSTKIGASLLGLISWLAFHAHNY